MTDLNSSYRRPPARRLRRAALAAALSAATVLGLSACDVQPGAAAFIGGERITQDQVEKIVSSVRDRVQQGKFGDVRQSVLADLVVRDLGRRLAAAQGVRVPPADYDAAAEQIGLPADSPYVRVDAEATASVAALAQAAGNRKPSRAAVTEQYKLLVSEQAVRPGVSFDQVRQQLAEPGTEQLVAVWTSLVKGLKQYHVTVNPRYGALNYPVQGPSGAIAFRLAKGDPAVVTAPVGGDSSELVGVAPETRN